MDLTPELFTEDDKECDESALLTGKIEGVSASASAPASASASAAASVSASTAASACAAAASAAASAPPDETDADSREILALPSKKHRTSGDFLGQNFAVVTGINLREEEKLILSGPQEGAQASEATRNIVQEEEEKLFLDNKVLLQKKLADISYYFFAKLLIPLPICYQKFACIALEILKRHLTRS